MSNLKSKLIFVGIIIVLLGISFAVGRYTKKADVVTQIKTVEVIKEVQVKDSSLDKKNNRQTHTIITERPDGTKITEIWEINKDTVVIHDKEIVEKEIAKKEELINIIKTSNPQWLASGGYGFNFDDKRPVYTLGIHRRILGPVFIGLEGSSDKVLSGIITAEF
jgi:hypothetical protein